MQNNAVTKISPLELPLMSHLVDAILREAGCGQIDQENFFASFSAAIRSDVTAVWVYQKDDKIIGTISGGFIADPLTGVLTAYEQFWFVQKEHRSGKAGLALYNALYDEAKARKCRKILMLHMMTMNAASMQRFYRKAGYELVEQVFRKLI